MLPIYSQNVIDWKAFLGASLKHLSKQSAAAGGGSRVVPGAERERAGCGGRRADPGGDGRAAGLRLGARARLPPRGLRADAGPVSEAAGQLPLVRVRGRDRHVAAGPAVAGRSRDPGWNECNEYKRRVQGVYKRHSLE